MVQSLDSGNFYATVKKCSVSSTFSEEQAAQFIGKQLPGTINRMDCDPYDFTIPETGEVIELSHRWVYSPEESTPDLTRAAEATIIESPLAAFSNNGVAAMA